MNHHEIVKKLIGQIKPVGETNTDNERMENLIQMCNLVENLLYDIEDMAFLNRDSQEFSVKRSVDFANGFLEKKGIK